MAQCRLCKRDTVLQESHIIPKFVIRWLKDSSATGYLRASPAINRRSQDGLKAPLLCADCEGQFSQWESEVAKRIFYPFNKDRPKLLAYGPWLLKFAVSVSWRSLTHYIDATSRSEYSEEGLQLIEKALRAWREFLLDRGPHPGPFEQHMMLLDSIESASSLRNLPPNMNRFMIRGTHMNLVYSQGQPAFMFTKMGRIALFGFIGIAYPRRWKGTKIHVREGYVGGDISVPSQLLEYLAECARKAHEQYSSISPRQQEVIAEALRRNPDRAAASETFEAMDHDIRLFGKTAFLEDDPESEFETDSKESR